MLKPMAALLLVVLCLCLQSCVSSTSGLKSYVDSYDGYEFLYPNGWVPIKVKDGPDIVLHDIIEPSENVSVIISEVPEGKTLKDIGTPSDVGQRLAQGAISTVPERKAELVSATAQQADDETYYILEYAVQLPDQVRHNIASVVVRRGKLFTFNASTTEDRWNRMADKFQTVAKSFSVY